MRLTWEQFDPERLGYDFLSRSLTDFYQAPPWNEYLKCFACGGKDDFGPTGTYGLPQVDAGGLTQCPGCGRQLELFWSPARVEEYFRQLRGKGQLVGSTVLAEGEPAGWIWGYEITPVSPAPWGVQRDGKGMYADVVHVLPQYRDGMVLWYLLFAVLRQLRVRYSYVIARTHREADIVRTLFHRLGFEELDACPDDSQRGYWMWNFKEFMPEALSQ
jgi:hypothetical protein